MTPRLGRIVAGLLAGVLVGSPVGATELDTTSELIRLTDVVRYLRGRVLQEQPELLTDPEGQVAAFRRELARLDLDPPVGVPLDAEVGDLKLAGLLLEEQLRRRRSTRRRALVAATVEAFEVPTLGGEEPEEEAPQASGEDAGDSTIPEVARLFRAIHDDRAEVRLPGPHPAGGFPEAAAAAPAPSPSKTPEEAPPPTLEEELLDVGAKLRAALARVDAAEADAATDDPRYGDPTHKVSGADMGAPSLVEDAPVVAAAPETPAPAERSEDPVEAEEPQPQPQARPVPVAVDTRTAAVPAAAAVTPAPVTAADHAPAAGVVAVLERVLPLVQGQDLGPEEFPAVLRATLATFGVAVPGGFRPAPGDSAEAMARALLAEAGELDLGMAQAALGLL